VLAISKSDMLDEELMDALKQDLPEVPHLFISSVTNYGIQELKDLLWRELNKDGDYRKAAESITHRKLDVRSILFEDVDEDIPEDEDLEDEDEDIEYYEEDWDDQK